MEDVVEAVGEYLRREGGVAVMVMIDEESGSMFSELVDQVHVTRNTLSNRLEEGKDLNLLRETTHPSDHGNAVRYELTSRGEEVRHLLEEMETGEIYLEFLEARKKMRESIDFIEEVYQPRPYDPLYEEFEARESDEDDRR